MCWLGGFFTAYLIIRAVRSFRGGVGCLVVLLGAGSVEAATGHFYMKLINNSDSSITPTVMRNDNGGAFANGGTQAAVGAHSTSSWTYDYLGYTDHTYQIYCTNSSSHVGSDVVTMALTNTVYCTVGGAAPSYTNQVKCLGPWTNNASCSVMLWLTVTNEALHIGNTATEGPFLIGDVMPQVCATNILGVDGSGNGIPWTWTLRRSGCQNEDYMPVPIPDWDGPSSPDVINNPGTGGSVDPGITQNPPPVSNDDTNRTDRTEWNSQLDAIRRGIAELAGKVSTWPKQDVQTGLLGQIATNTGQQTSWTNLFSNQTNQLDELRAIKTNTFNTAKNVMDFATNANAFFGSMNTNMATVITNTDSPTSSDLSNAVAAALAAGNYASNLFTTEWQKAGGEGEWATNGMNSGWLGGTGPSAPFQNPMAVSIGHVGATYYTLSCSLRRNVDFLSLKLLTLVPWVRKWLAWAVALTLFLLCADRMDEVIRQMYFGAQISIKPAGAGSVKLYGMRVASLIYLVGTTIVVLAIVPTILIAWLHSSGVENPMSATAFLDDIVNMGDSAVVEVAKEYLTVLMLMIPIDAVGTALFTWITFYFTARFWLRIGLEVVRWLGFVIPCLVFLWAGSVQAGQLRFENLSGASVVTSNGYEVVTFPVGVTERMAIADGTWSLGASNSFTVLGGYQVVRACGDTNAPGTVVLVQWQGYSPYSWWVIGMNCGFLIFGTTWAVSAARSGILLRVRE